MKLTVTRANLSRELQLANEVIDRKNTIPILAYMLIDAKNKGVSIAATNLTEWLRTSLESDVDRPGKAVLPIELIHRLVGGFSDGPITLDASAQSVKVTSGQSVTKFPTLPVEDFPIAPDSIPQMAELPSGELRRVLQQLRHAVRADGRYWLDGALVTILEGRFKGAATDGHRISEAYLPINGKSEPLEMILPAKALDCLVKILGIEDADAPVTFGVGERFSSWSVGSRTLFARMVDGNFPKYQRAIPARSTSIVRIDTEPLRQALKRLMVVVTKDKCSVAFAVSKGEVLCRSESHIGVFTEPVAADYDGQDARVILDPSYVLDALNALDAEAIRMCLTDEEAPALFRPINDEDRLCVISAKRF